MVPIQVRVQPFVEVLLSILYCFFGFNFLSQNKKENCTLVLLERRRLNRRFAHNNKKSFISNNGMFLQLFAAALIIY
jgi:hypothetical protein